MVLFRLILAVLITLLMAGCQSPVSAVRQTGSLSIKLPPASSRSAGAGGTFRIELLQNNAPVSLPGTVTGQAYLSVPSASGSTVTINALTPGTGYEVFVANGDTDVNGYFVGDYFQESAPFSVTAGSTAAVSVTLAAVPYSVLEDNLSSLHVASDTYDPAETLYYISGSNINYFTEFYAPVVANAQTQFSAFPASIVPAIKVYSLNPTGPYGFWLGTDHGVVQAPTNLTAPAMPGLTGALPVVYKSGYVYLSGNGSLEYYYGPGATAGFAVNGDITSGVPTWNPLSGHLTGAAATALAAAVAQGKQAVTGLDYYYFGNFLYLATAFGTFSLPATILTSAACGTSTTFYGYLSTGLDTNANSLAVSLADPTASVGPVSVFAPASGTAYGFAGTNKGLFGAQVSLTTGLPSGTLALVTGTSGLEITCLATAKINNAMNNPNPPAVPTVFTAAYSATTNELLILNNLTVVTRIPEFAGLPSGTPKLTWFSTSINSTTTLYLVITGTDATVTYPVASWAYQSLG